VTFGAYKHQLIQLTFSP